MTKKCIICGKEAVFCVKESSEYYCDECAKEQFADISYLQKIEEEAKKLKKIVDEKLEDSWLFQ